MSTPNDNLIERATAALHNANRHDIATELYELHSARATQPSPAAVELALAERQANAEKINATVEQARASATQPQPSQGEQIQIDWQAVAQEATDLYYATRNQRDTLLEERNTAIQERNELREQMRVKYAELKRERDALQAQRDELLVALKGITRYAEAVRYTAGMGENQLKRFEAAKAAIARATEGQPNES